MNVFGEHVPPTQAERSVNEGDVVELGARSARGLWLENIGADWLRITAVHIRAVYACGPTGRCTYWRIKR